MFGVRRGYAGLVAGSIVSLGSRDVSGKIQRGGTFLGTARCPEFATDAGRGDAVRQLSQHGIDSLVVIGGNGSQQGSFALSERGFEVVGIASTIDNDLYGSDVTIGVDTALNIALEAIDRIKVTASSHERGNIVEVMGRGITGGDCGYLALMAGITGGAEAVVIPEREMTPDSIAKEFQAAYEKGKNHAIVVVAEGARSNAEALVHHFKEHENLHFDLRVTILGHVQRGGIPTAFDRLLGTRFGAGAVAAIERKEYGCLVGLRQGAVQTTPLSEVVSKKKELDLELLDLAGVLAQ